ncbi:YtcJ-like metal dependent amidohydrolase [Erythrobacter litoralis]|uniref:Amidohydrolase n=1 Tax=Erythrobacter litoralis TaxID=39960 RepID=A0A074N152_9SPHN|nr:amidohydrolase [Erythrobacter litoralis]AOL23866.1 YtcJ-like metal dependent amidohydrolase [Erythrobacter litoralis]KEO98650.1 amidohydrolase [Erythrobacter litoralis]
MKGTTMRAFRTGAAALMLSIGTIASAQTADRIWTGGPIITMEDDAMRAEAIAEEDGRIVAVGTSAEVMKFKGPQTEITDLDGRTLLPGFVDAHGHVTGGGVQALGANLLAPPDGTVKDIPSLLEVLRQWMRDNKAIVDRYGIIIGFGYDNATLAEARHPTRDELDTVSSTVPIYLIHQSGHFGATNSAGLAKMDITRETPDPAGGIIRKRADGEPDGVLEEAAHFSNMGKLFTALDAAAAVAIVKAGTDLWARFGYTTAQDGRATGSTIALLEGAAAAGRLPIDVVAYIDVLVDRDMAKAKSAPDYVGRFRVGGGKLTIDGSPQGFTGWRDKPYYDPVGDYPPDYAGYAAVTREQVFAATEWAYANDVQLLTHSNGEAAHDLLIGALGQAEDRHGKGDRRPVLIHGQFLRKEQIAAFDRLGVIPSLFPMHTFYWGDWHRDHTVGPVDAENISPTGWVRERKMIFTSHHDAPVAFPDSMRVLDATVTRRSRSGDILGPQHRMDVITALKAMTIWPAFQHFEEDRKGSLAVGKLADFVILSADPTAVDPETIDRITVEETIKEGTTIYKRR